MNAPPRHVKMVPHVKMELTLIPASVKRATLERTVKKVLGFLHAQEVKFYVFS